MLNSIVVDRIYADSVDVRRVTVTENVFHLTKKRKKKRKKRRKRNSSNDRNVRFRILNTFVGYVSPLLAIIFMQQIVCFKRYLLVAIFAPQWWQQWLVKWDCSLINKWDVGHKDVVLYFLIVI